MIKGSVPFIEAKALYEQADKEPDDARARQLKAQADEIDSQWGANGTLRLVAHTVIGGLTGGASGAAGAAAGTITAPLVATALADADVDPNLGKIITALASTATGAVVGGTAGAGAALNEVTNNYLSHPEALKAEAARKRQQECRDDACRQDAQKEIDAYAKLSAERDDALRSACAENPAGANCQIQIVWAKESARSYQGQSIPRSSALGEYAAQAARMADTPHYQPEALKLLAARIGMPMLITATGAAAVTAAQIVGYCATNPVACNAAGVEIASLLGGEALPVGIGVATGVKVVREASSTLQGARLNEYYRQLEKYGEAGVRELENGRFRFYGELTPARTPGEMSGARLVREWDPATNSTRTWYETLDNVGNIRSIAPKPVTDTLNHRIFDANGNYTGRR